MKKALSLFVIMLSCLFSEAATYYWVGNSGNWSDYANHWATTSGGLIFHTQTPGPNDNVFFDANSFTTANQIVTLDTTLVNCKNMNWNGAINNPTLKASVLDKPVNIYGTLRLSSGMSIDLSVRLVLQSSSTQNIRTAGVIIPYLSIAGSGSWYLQDALTTQAFNFSNGSLYSQGFAISTDYINVSTADTFDITGSTVSCLYDFKIEIFADPVMVSNGSTLNAANLTCEYIGGTGQTFNDVNVAGQILTTGSNGVFTFHDVNASTIVSNNTYFHNATIKQKFTGSAHKVLFTGANSILSDAAIDSLQFGPLVTNISLSGITTINNLMEVNGTCSNWIKMSSSDLFPATISKASGTVTLNYVLLEKISGIGGATFIANNSVDLGGNSGWTINSSASQNLYWVGGSGNWGDVSHWSLTSGGAAGACLPGANDNVFFDVNSFSSNGDSVTINTSLFCKNMNWTGATHNPVLRTSGMMGTINIYGSLTLTNNMAIRSSVGLFLQSSSTSYIASAGVLIPSLSIKGNGSYFLSDALTTEVLSVNNGAFYSQGFTVNANSVLINNSDTLNITGSVINCSSDFRIGSLADPIIVSNGSTINAVNLIYDNTSASGKTFNDVNLSGDLTITNVSGTNSFNDVTGKRIAANNGVYHNVVVAEEFTGTAHKVLFIDANTQLSESVIDSLLFSPSVAAVSLTGTIIINNFVELNGNCSHWIKLSGAHGVATLSKTNGTVNINYVLLENITGTAGAAFIANNTVDLGGNSGWTINSAALQSFYWIGGSGNWEDANHWSLTSGGSAVTCIPAANDNVNFDANSFNTANENVTINGTVYCKNMNWNGIVNSVTLIANASSTKVNVYGSLTLNNKLNIDNSVDLNLHSSATENISSLGGSLKKVSFDGTGRWHLNDKFHAQLINFNSGSLYTDGNSINSDYIYISTGDTMDFTGSEINCVYDFTYGTGEDPAFIFTGSTLNVYSLINNNSALTGKTFNDVNADGINVYGSIGNNIFHNVKGERISVTNGIFNNVIAGVMFYGPANFANKLSITGNNVFLGECTVDTLQLINAGNTIFIDAGTLTVNNFIHTNASPSFPITINGSNTNTTTLNVPSGSVCLDYIVMKDLHTGGAASFNAGDNSSDLGNNTGWSFTGCTPVLTNVWPGDANNDLVVDYRDILNIGIAYGYTGTTRASAGSSWVAQPSLTWDAQFLNGSNLNNADCDGNGIVNELDTNVVALNYGQVHVARNPVPVTQNSTGVPLHLNVPSVLTPGSAVSIPLVFGDVLNPANDVYGIATSINYDPSFVQAGSLNISYTNSWLSTAGNSLHFDKDFSVTGNIDIAMSRIDQQNVSGNGTIATLNFIVANTASGNFNINISNAKAIESNELEIPVQILANIATGINDVNELSSVSVYPNPVNDYLYFTSLNSNIKAVMIYDYTGKLILNEKTSDAKIFAGNLNPGIYLLNIFDNQKNMIVNKKIVKQ